MQRGCGIWHSPRFRPGAGHGPRHTNGIIAAVRPLYHVSAEVSPVSENRRQPALTGAEGSSAISATLNHSFNRKNQGNRGTSMCRGGARREKHALLQRRYGFQTPQRAGKAGRFFRAKGSNGASSGLPGNHLGHPLQPRAQSRRARAPAGPGIDGVVQQGLGLLGGV